jgi:hypothetical protein
MRLHKWAFRARVFKTWVVPKLYLNMDTLFWSDPNAKAGKREQGIPQIYPPLVD